MSTQWRWNRLALLSVLAVAIACDSGGGSGCGCGSGDGPPYVFEGTAEDHVVFQGGQVHVTQSGLDRISSNLEPLLGSVLGDGGLSFCIPPTSVSAGITITLCDGSRCDDGSAGCQLDAQLSEVQIRPVRTADPASDQVSVSALLRLNESLDTSLFGCSLVIADVDGMPVSLAAYLNVNPPLWERVFATLPGDEISFDLNRLDISIDGGFACSALNVVLSLASGLVTGLIEDQLSGPINDALGPALCTQCDETTPCPGAATCNSDGLCMEGDTCVPLALGVETEVDLGGLLADFAPGLDAKLGVMAYASSYADAMGPPSETISVPGIDLGLQLGFYSDADPCVPYAEPPANDRVPKSDAIAANATPAGADFAVGIGVDRSALNMALWAVYRSGALCLSIGSDTVEQISTGTFSVLLPSLGALTGGANRPMFIQLRPQSPPTIDLGAGTVTESGEIDEPLLIVNLTNVDMDFYVFAEDRYVRLMELNADLTVPLGLDANAEGQLVVLLGDLASAITRLEVQSGDLLSEADAGRVATVLPSLVGALLPALAGDLIPPIDIPEILEGVTIVIPPGGITSVEDEQMLAIYADLEIAAAKSAPTGVEILASQVDGPTPEELETRIADARTTGASLDPWSLVPVVRLELAAYGAGPFDFSYRVNEGAWSIWRPASDVVEVRDIAMALSGRYVIDVRLRSHGDSRTASLVPARTEILIDYVPPVVSVARLGAQAVVSVDDVHSSESMRAEVRVNFGAWLPIEGGSAEIDLAHWAGGNAVVEVAAVDGMGNRTTKRETFNLDDVAAPEDLSAERRRAPEQTGCAAAPRSTSGGWIVIAGALLALARTRRRALLGVVGLAVVLVAGCNDQKNNSGEAGVCKPACAEGSSCVDGACVPDTGCDGSGDCEAPLVCVDGACVDPSTGCDCAVDEVCVEGVCVPAATDCTGPADCPEGQDCVEGACVATGCDGPADCPPCTDGSVECADGVCSCGPPCPEGCADGTACCNATGICVEVEAGCGAGSCDPGYAYVVVGETTWDPASCTAGATCDCVELPPLPLGDHGQYLDVAVSPDGATRAVAAYNETYGDLMVGVIDDAGAIDWSFVDGVPADGAIGGALGGPRGGVTTAGPDVGQYPSIAIDGDGHLHVAYYARSGDNARHLMYGRGTPGASGFSWVTMVADPLEGAGLFTDIEVQPDGRPLIGYAVPLTREPGGAYVSAVRVAQPDTALPTTTEAFGNFTLSSSVIPLGCGGGCGSRSECRVDLNVCQATARDSECADDCGDGACFENEDGSFVCSALAEGLTGLQVLYFGTGVFLDIEIFGDGEMGAAWYDHMGGNLMYVQTNTGNFTPSDAAILDGQVDSAEGPVDTGDVGWYPDLYVSSAGTRWLSYADHTRGTLRVIDLDSRVSTPVDDGVRCYDTDPSGACIAPLLLRVGYDSAIAESDGALFMAYQDATWHEILESPLSEFGWDLPGTVATGGLPYTGAYGFYIAHARSAAGRFVVTERLNMRATPPTRDVVVLER